MDILNSDDFKALVLPNGFVYYITPFYLAIPCNVSFDDFPFDKQDCKVSFGSWHYSSKKVRASSFANGAKLVVFARFAAATEHLVR